MVVSARHAAHEVMLCATRINEHLVTPGGVTPLGFRGLNLTPEFNLNPKP